MLYTLLIQDCLPSLFNCMLLYILDLYEGYSLGNECRKYIAHHLC